jgi:hypothetical protein
VEELSFERREFNAQWIILGRMKEKYNVTKTSQPLNTERRTRDCTVFTPCNNIILLFLISTFSYTIYRV